MTGGDDIYVGRASAPDKYRLLNCLGRGGEGEVWSAEQRLSDQGRLRVAVKILHGLSDSRSTESWERHADLLKSVEHPGLVRILDHFTGPSRFLHNESSLDTDRYVVMALVEGNSLRDWVSHHPVPNLEDRLAALGSIANALDELHSGRQTTMPVAHGDVKPANIIVRGGGRPSVLVDLGLMRISDGTALFALSAPYAAPELFMREPVTPMTDRFAFAATVAHLVLGEPPPVSKSTHGLDLEQTESALAASALGRKRPRLRLLIMMALRAEPDKRPDNLTVWLASLIESLPVEVTDPAPPIPSGRSDAPTPPADSSKELPKQFALPRLRVWVASAVAVAMCLIVGVWIVVSEPDPPGGWSGAFTPCAGEPTDQLLVTSSQEKAQLLGDLAEDYGKRQVSGQCLEIRVQTGNSGKFRRQLEDGWRESDGQRPDVWSPASQAWFELTRSRADEGKLPPTAESLFSSPVVIGMPKPMAEAMGWPDAKIGWKDLAALAADPKGWAKYNVGWGRFKLGKTNPNYSSSGLAATVGAFFAYTGKSNELGRSDVDNPKTRQAMRNLERSVVHYGDTTLTFLANLRRADDRGAALSYVSAVTVEEASLIAYNLGYPCGAKSSERGCAFAGKPKTPLVAVYPTEGTQASSHPFVKLSGLSSSKSALADDFVQFVHSDQAIGKIAALGFRTVENQPTALITQANGTLPNVKLNLLGQPASDVLEHLLEVWPTLRKNANVLFLVDASKSMDDMVPEAGKTKIVLLKEAWAGLVQKNLREGFGANDRVGLWKFADHLDGPRDYVPVVPAAAMGTSIAETSQRGRINTEIAKLTPEGGTGLFNTIAAAAGTIRDDWDPDAINAVVVLTDGRNETSRGFVEVDELTKRIRSTERPVRVFSIAYGSAADPDDQNGQTDLEKIANETDAARYDASRATDITDALIAVISNF